jgi:hypothetical protein
VSIDQDQYRDACKRASAWYAERSAKSLDNPGIQLACLVLANHCIYEWSGDYGGPPLEVVQLAESISGTCLKSVIDGLVGYR